MLHGPDSLIADIVASHDHLTADRILCQLIPESTDSVVRECCIVEIGVSQVEADIHQTHNDTFTRVSLMTSRWFVNRQGIDDGGRRVHLQTTGAIGFDAAH